MRTLFQPVVLWRAFIFAASMPAVLAVNAAPSGADPKALITLLEQDPHADRNQPWPSGLRIVIYDDGQALVLTRSYYKRYPDEITRGTYAPAEARRIAAQLAGLMGEQPSVYYRGR